MQWPGAMGPWCDLVPDLSDKQYRIFPSDPLRSCKRGARTSLRRAQSQGHDPVLSEAQ